MIVFPMAGKSSRFAAEGFTNPKYMLPLWGKTMLHWVVKGFRFYKDSELFVFLVKDVEAYKLIDAVCSWNGIKHYSIVFIEKETRGQAETIYLGLEGWVMANQAITIFNIDTIMSPSYRLANVADLGKNCVAFMDCFVGDGAQWSFAEIDAKHRITNVAEKFRISPFCSTGLYYFKRFSFFAEAFLASQEIQLDKGQEYYVAPLLNWLIRNDCDVRMNLIELEQIYFAGTPSEYRKLGVRPYTSV